MSGLNEHQLVSSLKNNFYTLTSYSFLFTFLFSEVRSNGEYVSKRRIKILSGETVKLFSKDFSKEQLRTETENTYQYNRVGTRNRFFFTAFRLYFDLGVLGRRIESKSITSSVGSRKPNMNCEIIWPYWPCADSLLVSVLTNNQLIYFWCKLHWLVVKVKKY